jgi:hypothetical protein
MNFMKRIMKTPILLVALMFLLEMTACTNPKETVSGNKPSGGTEPHSANTVNSTVNTNPANASTNANKNQSQTKTSAQCTLTQAPTMKGFTLGDTPEDIDRKIPGFKAAYDGEKSKSLAIEKKANFVLITSGSRLLENTNINSKEYEDTTLIWHFLDDRLMALVVKDTSVESADLSIMDFLSEVAAKYNLPKEGWKLGKENDADITCQGFEISLTAGGQPGMSVMITDTQAQKEKQKRQS